ncbi:MAG: F0F1 ATP synthase subunit A [Bdellovibrionales bacterium]|nr:F0F1 ATP synthase subunit A [Bdellovibrionales bacterium]
MIPGVDHHTIHVATLGVATGFLTLIAFTARAALGSGDQAVLPAKKFSIKAIFETITEFVVDLTVQVMGEKGKPYAAMFATLFFFILFNNLMGLVPGMTPATDNLNTTLAMGFFVFIVYNFQGIKEHGAGYIKQFLGPLWWLAWLMVIIELISHLVRPASLALRLRGNMYGDHMVLGVFLDLVPMLIPVIFYMIGIFVCFLQAFVFTLLTMIYVSMAISHDH